MKKKIVIIAIFIFIIGILLLGNVCKISFIKDIKDIFYEKVKMANSYEKKCTVIDVTDLEDGGSVEHDHTFKTMYDENQHWEECTVCGEVREKYEHTYNQTWALGTESCSHVNYATRVCSCGYSYIYHKPCVWKGEYYISRYEHAKKCSVCKLGILYTYYYNNKLYEADQGENGVFYKCRDRNGKRLNCNNSGTCATCSTAYSTSSQHYLYGERDESDGKNKLICIICGNNYGEYTTERVIDYNTPITYTIEDTVTLKNGATFNSIGGMRGNGDVWQKNTQIVGTNPTPTSTYFKLITTGKMKNKESYTSYTYFNVNIKGRLCRVVLDNFEAYPDLVKPEVSSITMENGGAELTEWSRIKPIIVSGIENWCEYVNVKIVDDMDNIVFQGKSNVVNNGFLISCIPELELDTNGKMFTLIVTDACENSTEQTFNIAKVDSFAPVPKSETEILGDWAKSKKFTFKATDGGIGEVSIAFNDLEDLSLANYDGIEYSRDYEFYGDVYTPKQLSVLYRDGLGNTSMQKITIDKLDNTSPTIENASIHNNVVTINAHDRHERVGEGSGIVKYRYIASSEKLSNPDFSSGIEVNVIDKMVIDNVYQVKYIYIIAEDYVGNISEVYELKVLELILTSRVDLSLANGKGGVILDWSTYDITDKYFVVYRKEENSDSWETIVSLDEKLTGSTYTDIFGNDKAKPDTPNINITGDVLNNNVKVDVISADNGTKYAYYIEAYDDGGNLVQTSN